MNLSGAHGYVTGRKNGDLLKKGMSGTQIEEAQRLYREWMDKRLKK